MGFKVTGKKFSLLKKRICRKKMISDRFRKIHRKISCLQCFIQVTMQTLKVYLITQHSTLCIELL